MHQVKALRHHSLKLSFLGCQIVGILLFAPVAQADLPQQHASGSLQAQLIAQLLPDLRAGGGFGGQNLLPPGVTSSGAIVQPTVAPYPQGQGHHHRGGSAYNQNFMPSYGNGNASPYGSSQSSPFSSAGGMSNQFGNGGGYGNGGYGNGYGNMRRGGGRHHHRRGRGGGGQGFNNSPYQSSYGGGGGSYGGGGSRIGANIQTWNGYSDNQTPASFGNQHNRNYLIKSTPSGDELPLIATPRTLDGK